MSLKWTTLIFRTSISAYLGACEGHRVNDLAPEQLIMSYALNTSTRVCKIVSSVLSLHASVEVLLISLGPSL